MRLSPGPPATGCQTEGPCPHLPQGHRADSCSRGCRAELEVTAGGPGPPLCRALLHRSDACKPGVPEDSGPRLTRQAGLPVRVQGSTGSFFRTPAFESHDGKRKIPTATQTMTSGEDTRPGSRLPPPMTSPRRCSEGSLHSSDEQGPLWPKALIRQANQSSRTAPDGPRLLSEGTPRPSGWKRGCAPNRSPELAALQAPQRVPCLPQPLLNDTSLPLSWAAGKQGRRDRPRRRFCVFSLGPRGPGWGWHRQLRFSRGCCQYFETWWPPKLSHTARERPARTASPFFLCFISQGVSVLKTSIFISVFTDRKRIRGIGRCWPRRWQLWGALSRGTFSQQTPGLRVT